MAAGVDAPRVTTALSEINVVPLVDVMLVLLIIFMVAAPMMQQGLEREPAAVAPRAGAAAGERSDLRHGAGRPSAAIASCRSATRSIRLDVLGRAHPPARRSSATTSRCSCAATAQVTMQQIMDVMDRLKDGGVEKVGLVSRPATDRR